MLDYSTEEQLLKNRLKQIVKIVNLETQRAFITAMSKELGEDFVTCAAALLYLLQAEENSPPVQPLTLRAKCSQAIKLIRYRLDIGSKHQLITETLVDVLVRESGVDKKNIHNVTIRELYTLIDLPDAMPLDIFQHLKTLEINSRKLDIRRVKNRNSKNNPHRR